MREDRDRLTISRVTGTPESMLDLEIAMSDARSHTGGTLHDVLGVLSLGLQCPGHLIAPGGRIIARFVPDGVESAPIPRSLVATSGVALHGEPVVSVVDGVRRVVAPVAADGTCFAHLAVCLTDGIDENLARWAVDRAVRHLTAEFIGQRRLARVAWNARANLGRQMIRGSSYDLDLRACAEYLGVDLNADRIIVFVLERGRSSTSTVDSGRLAEQMIAALGVDVLPIRGTEGVVLAIEVPSERDSARMIGTVTGSVVRALETMGDEQAVAGVSAVTRPGQLRRAYREAREVARCLDRYSGAGTRALASEELGPARLLVANSDEHAVRTYVFDVLGSLLDGSGAGVVLLRTLQEFFAHGRSIRETAVALDVHENTVRHRLAKVHDATGLDVAGSSNDQLSVHTALLVLRLQGHRAVPAFETGPSSWT